jgi:hypothetical protein
VVSFPQVSPLKPCIHFSPPHTHYMLCPSQSSWLDHPNYVWWGVQSIKLFVMQSSPLPCYLIHLGPKYRSYRRISPIPKHSVIFRYMINFLRLGVVSTSPIPPSWRTTPCRLSATAYSINSQLPSISAGRSSIRNLRTRHAMVTGTHISGIKMKHCPKYRNITSVKRIAVSGPQNNKSEGLE